MKKIKILLGAYVNYPNAQNINCSNISKYLDKSKFEVHTLFLTKYKINKSEYESKNVYLHRIINHRFIWFINKFLVMVFGNFDIYYLPKCETVDFMFSMLFRNKICVSSIEGVVGEQIDLNDSRIFKYHNKLMKNYFSISYCVSKSIKKYWNIDCTTLHLGVNPQLTLRNKKDNVKNIIWIGSIIDRKRPNLFLEVAKAFPNLNFVMIGDGNRLVEILKKVNEEKINNIKITGRIENSEVYKRLSESDLLLMTSEKEGLPKVIGEAMSVGVPSIYIKTHYEVDYITDGINGFGVRDISEIIEKIQLLIDNPLMFQDLSKNAFNCIKEFFWDKIIIKYEIYFQNVLIDYKKII